MDTKNVSWTLLVKLYCDKYQKEGKAKAEEWVKAKVDKEFYEELRPLVRGELFKRGVKV